MALHKNNTKIAEIGVEFGVPEVAEFFSDIQYFRYVVVRPLGVGVEGMTQNSAYNHKCLEQFLPNFVHILLITYRGVVPFLTLSIYWKYFSLRFGAGTILFSIRVLGIFCTLLGYLEYFYSLKVQIS